MKREQLLDAIGGVDESLLMETEQNIRHGRKTVGRLVFVAAVVTAFAITVAASTALFAGLINGDNGTTNQNLSTGMGKFVYSDDSVYYGTAGRIYQYDTQGNLLKEYLLDSENATPHYMFATEDSLVYSDGFVGLTILPKDGSEPKTALEDVAMTYVHIDGMQLYTTNGAEMLTRIDLVTMEKTDLLENVYAYYVDDSYIYAVRSSAGNCYYRSPKDVVDFEKIMLDFIPNKVIADGESLYFSEWIDEDRREEGRSRYQLNCVKDGITTKLPVYSWFYQIVDDCVLYREEGTDALKSYDMKTGEKQTLAEDVFEFAVLKDRYVCIDPYNGDVVILDWETVK